MTGIKACLRCVFIRFRDDFVPMTSSLSPYTHETFLLVDREPGAPWDRTERTRRNRIASAGPRRGRSTTRRRSAASSRRSRNGPTTGRRRTAVGGKGTAARGCDAAAPVGGRRAAHLVGGALVVRWPPVPPPAMSRHGQAVGGLWVAVAAIAGPARKRTRRPRASGPRHRRARPAADALRRATSLDPVGQGREDIEIVGRRAAGAMVHAGHQRRAGDLGRLRLASQRPGDRRRHDRPSRPEQTRLSPDTPWQILVHPPFLGPPPRVAPRARRTSVVRDIYRETAPPVDRIAAPASI